MVATLAEVVEGPFLIGLAMNVFLYGLVSMQVYSYFTTVAKDGFWLKTFVAILYLVDTFNCAIGIYYMYDALVVHFGDEANILRGSWVFAAGTASTGLISAGVQQFFVWRVYKLTKNMFVAAAVVLYSLASLAGSLATTITISIGPSAFQISGLQADVAIWLAGAVVADTIMAASLVWHLGRHKTAYPALSSVINRIIRMTVQTGVLTTVAAIIEMACYLTGNVSGKFEKSSVEEVSRSKSGVVVFHSQRTEPEVLIQIEPHQMIDMDVKPSEV
ncbi:hypothetical protein EDC04DRAFT_2891793 [Pisolithus marmoratus]|nr:hypothetical protein EDC04DRAFT_2891793 [Pisolithus marmoratus]